MEESSEESLDYFTAFGGSRSRSRFPRSKSKGFAINAAEEKLP
jgi:hypothetical protein